MAAITTTEANALLAASVGATAYPYTTAAKLALNTANGSASAAGTEVTGGSYGRLPVTWAVSSNGQISNSVAVSYTGMPAAAVTGVEIWDSAGTPNRKWYGALTTSRTTAAGDTLTFAAGALVLTLV